MCVTCKQKFEEEIEASGHVPSDEWEIVEEASLSYTGTMIRKCTVCGGIAHSKQFKMTEEEKDNYRPSIEGNHFDCTVDDFIENFKYKSNSSLSITKVTSDDESQAYILTGANGLFCTILCTKTDEGKMKAVLVNADDNTQAIAVAVLMANTIDDYFNPDDKETNNEILTRLLLGKMVEHDGLVVGEYDMSSGTSIVIAPN